MQTEESSLGEEKVSARETAKAIAQRDYIATRYLRVVDPVTKRYIPGARYQPPVPVDEGP